ncbi:MAG: hypothetical protein Q4C54_09645 [Clostridia bacterium]|nr:hypothetical protein [Clostridia bacterium]
MMDQKRAQLRDQLMTTRSIYDRMTAGTDLLRDSHRLNMVPRLTQGCAAYLVDFPTVADLFSAVSKSQPLKALIDAFPLTSFCTVLPLKRLEGFEAPLPVGICAPVEYANAIHTDFSAMHMSAGPRCVRCLFKLVMGKNQSVETVLDLCMAFIREQGLHPVCDGYTRQYVWYKDETGHRCHYAEMIIPVSD